MLRSKLNDYAEAKGREIVNTAWRRSNGLVRDELTLREGIALKWWDWIEYVTSRRLVHVYIINEPGYRTQYVTSYFE